MKSLGGLTVIPKTDISGIDISAAAIIILPGTMELMTSDIPEMKNLVTDCRKNNIPVAAICGATVFLARIGCLDTVCHTSNGLGYLKMMAPGYRGDRNYVHAPCISDRGIITANPFGHVEFAREIFRSLDLMAPEALEVIYQGYRRGYVDFDQVQNSPCH
ncbi:MAG: DJ-1/PfpI family protein [Methanoregula sp.]|nr:DJ-1/PfpI family protein [Methanoregula sp.]